MLVEFNICQEAPTEIPARPKGLYFRIDLHSDRVLNKYLCELDMREGEGGSLSLQATCNIQGVSR